TVHERPTVGPPGHRLTLEFQEPPGIFERPPCAPGPLHTYSVPVRAAKIKLRGTLLCRRQPPACIQQRPGPWPYVSRPDLREMLQYRVVERSLKAAGHLRLVRRPDFAFEQ